MPTIGDAARGRFLLILVIGSFCMTMLAIDVASWWNAEENHLIRMIARPLIVAALGAFALGGNRWARGLIAGWLGLMAVAFGGGAVMVVAAGKTLGVLTSPGEVARTSGTAFLLTSPDIKRFYDVADARRIVRSPAAERNSLDGAQNHPDS